MLRHLQEMQGWVTGCDTSMLVESSRVYPATRRRTGAVMRFAKPLSRQFILGVPSSSIVSYVYICSVESIGGMTAKP